jgi:hypothetical protein
MDHKLQALKRQALLGDLDAQVSFLGYGVHAGNIDLKNIELAAFLGDLASQKIFPDAELIYEEPYTHFTSGSNDVADVLQFGELDPEFVLPIIAIFAERVMPIWDMFVGDSFREGGHNYGREDPVVRGLEITHNYIEGGSIDTEEFLRVLRELNRRAPIKRGTPFPYLRSNYVAQAVWHILSVVGLLLGLQPQWDHLSLESHVGRASKAAVRAATEIKTGLANNKDEVSWQTRYLISQLLGY